METEEKVPIDYKKGFNLSVHLDKATFKDFVERCGPAFKDTDYYRGMVGGQKHREQDLFIQQMQAAQDKDKSHDLEK